MANIKEIVTKAVIGKTKKLSIDTFSVPVNENVSNVLGCWIINHTFNGTGTNNAVSVNGSYDINIWYSYDNNTKTNVIVHNYPYTETVNVKLKSNDALTNKNDIIVRSLTDPQVSSVEAKGNTIDITVEKELGVEIVGDMTVRVNVEDIIDDYDEEMDENKGDLDIDINENYLNGVNQN